jgi:hypothetical protein
MDNLLTILEHFIKVLQMRHDDISVLLQDGKSYEDVKVTTLIVCPQRLPQSKGVGPFELSLVPHKKHAEEEEKVGRVGGLQMEVELRVHELYKVVERRELLAHPGLVS